MRGWYAGLHAVYLVLFLVAWWPGLRSGVVHLIFALQCVLVVTLLSHRPSPGLHDRAPRAALLPGGRGARRPDAPGLERRLRRAHRGLSRLPLRAAARSRAWSDLDGHRHRLAGFLPRRGRDRRRPQPEAGSRWRSCRRRTRSCRRTPSRSPNWSSSRSATGWRASCTTRSRRPCSASCSPRSPSALLLDRDEVRAREQMDQLQVAHAECAGSDAQPDRPPASRRASRP